MNISQVITSLLLTTLIFITEAAIGRPLAFDTETTINDRAKARFENLEIEPDSKLAGINDPPKAITALKGDALRSERLARWQEDQAKKLSASIATQRAKLIDRAALHWTTAEIVCIVAIDPETRESGEYARGGERAILDRFFTDLVNRWPYHDLIGQNALGFDIPVLVGRALVHDIGIPEHLKLMPGRPIRDVSRMFSLSQQSPQLASLEQYAWALGIEGKCGKASEVRALHEAAENGDEAARDALTAYCRQDTSIVVEIVRRYSKPFGAEGLRAV